jgi:hypothetical protein
MWQAAQTLPKKPISKQIQYLQKLAGSLRNVFQISKGEDYVIESIVNNANTNLLQNAQLSSCTDPHCMICHQTGIVDVQ